MRKLIKIKQSILWGPTVLMIAGYVNQIISPLISIMVVRYLGDKLYGFYASAYAITTLITVLPEFGLQQSALRLNAIKQCSLSLLVKKSLNISLLYAICSYILLIIWLEYINYNVAVKIVGMVFGLTFFRVSLVTAISTGLQIKGKYNRIALWNLLISSSQWICTLIAMLYHANLFQLVIFPTLLSLIISLLMYFWEKNNDFNYNNKKSEIISYKELFSYSWRFGLANSMHQFYHRSDAAILSAFRNPTEVGYYTVAFRIVELIFYLPGIVFNQVLYPKYFKWSKRDRGKLKIYFSLMNKVMIILSLILMCMIFIISDEIIQVIGFEGNISSIYLFIMSFAIPFRFVASSVGGILTTDGQINSKLKIQSLMAIINIGMNVILIPIYGGVASSALLVLTDGLLLLLYSTAVYRSSFNFPFIKQIIILISSQLILGIMFFALNHFSLLIRLFCLFLLFICMIPICILVFDNDEKAIIKKLIKGSVDN